MIQFQVLLERVCARETFHGEKVKCNIINNSQKWTEFYLTRWCSFQIELDEKRCRRGITNDIAATGAGDRQIERDKAKRTDEWVNRQGRFFAINIHAFFDTFVVETESPPDMCAQLKGNGDAWGEGILPDSLSFLHINASSFHIYQFWDLAAETEIKGPLNRNHTWKGTPDGHVVGLVQLHT